MSSSHRPFESQYSIATYAEFEKLSLKMIFKHYNKFTP